MWLSSGAVDANGEVAPSGTGGIVDGERDGTRDIGSKRGTVPLDGNGEPEGAGGSSEVQTSTPGGVMLAISDGSR